MPEQLAFAGFGGLLPLTDNLFFALLPETAAAARIAQRTQQLRDRHALKGRPIATERLHVSLHHVGEYPDFPRDLAARAIETAADIVMPPFDMAFDRVMSFSGKPKSRPLVLCGSHGIAKVVALQRTLGDAMQKVGLGRMKPSFTPHVTLLYDERAMEEQPIEPIGWTVREFVLIHSLLGQGVYKLLGRWPLRG